MMTNLSEDIQSASSDTRPPMLDRSDFESWQQHIRLYCKGKVNGENILQSIDEGPFKMGKFRETLADGALVLERDLTRISCMLYLMQHEGKLNENKMMLERYTQHAIDPLAFGSNVSLQQYPTQSSAILQSAYVLLVTYQQQFADNTQLNSGLTPTDDLIENLTKTVALLAQSYKTHFPQTNNQLRTSSNTRNQAIVQNGKVVVQNVQGRQHRVQGNNARGAVAAGNGGVHYRVGNANPGQAKPIKCYNCNGIGDIARQCTHPKRPQNSEYFKDKMLLMQAQENGVVLDEEQLLFIAGGQDNTFDDDVDEPPVQDLALNVDQVFQADQCDAFDSDVDEAPTAQTMFMENLSSADPIYDEGGLSYDSDILYEYVKNNAEHVEQSNVSFVPNDDLMKIINDMHEHATQCIFANEQNKVVNESLTVELARYKEQVKIYEKGQEQVRKVELETNISKFKHKIQKDDHSEMIKRFSNLEVDHLNLQLKYQNLKESFGNNKSQTAQDAPEFDSFFKINKMKEPLQGKNNTIRQLKVQISHMNERRSEAGHIPDFKALDSQNLKLTEHVTALQEQN
ncbi:hypothetical protein Tco_1405050 [Tanacetum coccineum]